MGRIERVNQQIKREISQILQSELQDPRFEFVSITRVDVSRDLQTARVYFSTLGDQNRVDNILSGLQNARGLIRRELGRRVKIRFTPELMFHYDHSIEFGAKLEETLQELHDENEKNYSDD